MVIVAREGEKALMFSVLAFCCVFLCFLFVLLAETMGYFHYFLLL